LKTQYKREVVSASIGTNIAVTTRFRDSGHLPRPPEAG